MAIMSNRRSVEVTYPALATHLQAYGLEENLEEITFHILNSRKNADGVDITDWSVYDLTEWIHLVSCLKPQDKKICQVFDEEEIDGFSFIQLVENDWLKILHLDIREFIILKSIRDGWLTGWGETVNVPPNFPPGVAVGIMADLSTCTTSHALKLVQADIECSRTGKGYYYGQLVVLGYKEYHEDQQIFQPVGHHNEKYVLKRRKIPNGIQLSPSTSTIQTSTSHTLNTNKIGHTNSYPHNKLLSSSSHSLRCHLSSNKSPSSSSSATNTSTTTSDTVTSSLIFNFSQDPSYDIYQIGRAPEPHNDYVIKGPLHMDPNGSGQQCGPVSRLACRIICERLPPYRCYIYAGGYSRHDKELIIPASNIKWYDTNIVESMQSTSTTIPPHLKQRKYKHVYTTTNSTEKSYNDTLHVHSSPNSQTPTYNNSIHKSTSPTLSENTMNKLTDSLDLWDSFDALTTYGIKVYHPELKEWYEVSVKGNIYSPRVRNETPGERLNKPHISPPILTTRWSNKDTRLKHTTSNNNSNNNSGSSSGNRSSKVYCSDNVSYEESIPKSPRGRYHHSSNHNRFTSNNNNNNNNNNNTGSTINSSNDVSSVSSSRGTGHSFMNMLLRREKSLPIHNTTSTPNGSQVSTNKHKEIQTDPVYTNELIDGCIIDICGVCLLFQKPSTMANIVPINTDRIISNLNQMMPQCPVLMNTLQFSYMNPKDRAKRAISQLEKSGVSYITYGPIHIPTTTYDDIPEECRTYIFPACGHVFGYHKSLEHVCCPLCRMQGPYVPIAFPFEGSICKEVPTHVFNPCGHAASRETCERWSDIYMYDVSIHTKDKKKTTSGANQDHVSNSSGMNMMRPQCPFCAKPLQTDKSKGGPYNRLIIQSEATGQSSLLPETTATTTTTATNITTTATITASNTTSQKNAMINIHIHENESNNAVQRYHMTENNLRDDDHKHIDINDVDVDNDRDNYMDDVTSETKEEEEGDDRWDNMIDIDQIPITARHEYIENTEHHHNLSEKNKQLHYSCTSTSISNNNNNKNKITTSINLSIPDRKEDRKEERDKQSNKRVSSLYTVDQILLTREYHRQMKDIWEDQRLYSSSTTTTTNSNTTTTPMINNKSSNVSSSSATICSPYRHRGSSYTYNNKNSHNTTSHHTNICRYKNDRSNSSSNNNLETSAYMQSESYILSSSYMNSPRNKLLSTIPPTSHTTSTHTTMVATVHNNNDIIVEDEVDVVEENVTTTTTAAALMTLIPPFPKYVPQLDYHHQI